MNIHMILFRIIEILQSLKIFIISPEMFLYSVIIYSVVYCLLLNFILLEK